MRVDTAEFIRAAHRSDDFLRDGRPEVAFVGRSNVGKSSLLNRLLGRKSLARTSSTPGRTRSINYFLVNDRLYFVDLPGYGYAKAGRTDRQAWAALVGRYFERRGGPRQVVLLVDGKVGATPLDVQGYEYLAGHGGRIVVAVTKIDRVPRGKRAAVLQEVGHTLGARDARLVPVSAETGEGIGELWREIELGLAPGARQMEDNEERHG